MLPQAHFNSTSWFEYLTSKIPENSRGKGRLIGFKTAFKSQEESLGYSCWQNITNLRITL